MFCIMQTFLPANIIRYCWLQVKNICNGEKPASKGGLHYLLYFLLRHFRMAADSYPVPGINDHYRHNNLCQGLFREML